MYDYRVHTDTIKHKHVLMSGVTRGCFVQQCERLEAIRQTSGSLNAELTRVAAEHAAGNAEGDGAYNRLKLSANTLLMPGMCSKHVGS